MQVSSDVITSFQELRQKQTGPSFLIFKMEKGQCVIEKRGQADSSFADFVAALPSDTARWAVTTVKFQTNGGGLRSKVVFVSWIPSTANKVDKMSYAMFQGTLRQAITGCQCVVSAHDLSDLDPNAVLERAGKYERDGIDMEAGLLN